jgi:hypothetical protein
MTDADDPIPAPCPEVTILIGEAFVLVYRALSPDFEILEERLNGLVSHRGLTSSNWGARCSGQSPCAMRFNSVSVNCLIDAMRSSFSAALCALT